jgi:hypothetical protein
MYTKSDFGKALLEQLNKGYDIIKLSDWAFSIHMSRCGEFADGVQDVVMQIVAMREGPEFEFSESELRDYAKNLL